MHARSAVGVNVLPLGVPVEIEAIVEISDDSENERRDDGAYTEGENGDGEVLESY